MSEIDLRARKKHRRLDTLASVRRELAEIYHKAKATEPDSLSIQQYRALTFILNTIADVLRSEQLDDIEARLDALEQKEKGYE
ncbi:MAG TPA: hypothetical protein PLE76_08060 [Rectinema sp.]|jgi:hypothetical protein|nr:hypothetical protein [Rectinema sp.]HRU02767.1 hypothetical protein [Rectinema sp.]